MSDLLCLIGRHKFRPQRSPDGSATYLECLRCGYVPDDPDGMLTAAS